MDANCRKITYEEFQTRLEEIWDRDTIRYRETGKHGWDELGFDDKGRPKLTHKSTGPHYADAAPIGKHPLATSGKLLGTYDFNEGIAKFFCLPNP